MGVDIFIKLTGPQGDIKGESKDKHFPGFIEADDIELSARSLARYSAAKDKERRSEEDDGDAEGSRPLNEPRPSKQMARHKVALKKDPEEDSEGSFTLKVTKDLDYCSPDLAQSYSKNLAGVRDKFPKLRVYLRKRGTDNFIYLLYTFVDVYVVNYSIALSGGGHDATSIPVETVEFTFSGLGMKYVPQLETGAAGSPSFRGWDFKKRERNDDLAN